MSSSQYHHETSISEEEKQALMLLDRPYEDQQHRHQAAVPPAAIPTAAVVDYASIRDITDVASSSIHPSHTLAMTNVIDMNRYYDEAVQRGEVNEMHVATVAAASTSASAAAAASSLLLLPSSAVTCVAIPSTSGSAASSPTPLIGSPPQNSLYLLAEHMEFYECLEECAFPAHAIVETHIPTEYKVHFNRTFTPNDTHFLTSPHIYLHSWILTTDPSFAPVRVETIWEIEKNQQYITAKLNFTNCLPILLPLLSSASPLYLAFYYDAIVRDHTNPTISLLPSGQTINGCPRAILIETGQNIELRQGLIRKNKIGSGFYGAIYTTHTFSYPQRLGALKILHLPYHLQYERVNEEVRILTLFSTTFHSTSYDENPFYDRIIGFESLRLTTPPQDQANVDHSHIVQLHAAFVDPYTHRVHHIMDYYSGGDMEHFLQIQIKIKSESRRKRVSRLSQREDSRGGDGGSVENSLTSMYHSVTRNSYLSSTRKPSHGTPYHLPALWIRSWACQLCFALVSLKSCGIIHNDICPKNILFNDNTYLKLVVSDFSVAYQIGTPIGNMQMFRAIAPELLPIDDGQDTFTYPTPSYASDLWSCGMILLRCMLLIESANPIETAIQWASWNEATLFDWIDHEARQMTVYPQAMWQAVKAMLRVDPTLRCTAEQAILQWIAIELSMDATSPSPPLESLPPRAITPSTLMKSPIAAVAPLSVTVEAAPPTSASVHSTPGLLIPPTVNETLTINIIPHDEMKCQDAIEAVPPTSKTSPIVSSPVQVEIKMTPLHETSHSSSSHRHNLERQHRVPSNSNNAVLRPSTSSSQSQPASSESENDASNAANLMRESSPTHISLNQKAAQKRSRFSTASSAQPDSILTTQMGDITRSHNHTNYSSGANDSSGLNGSSAHSSRLNELYPLKSVLKKLTSSTKVKPAHQTYYASAMDQENVSHNLFSCAAAIPLLQAFDYFMPRHIKTLCSSELPLVNHAQHGIGHTTKLLYQTRMCVGWTFFSLLLASIALISHLTVTSDTTLYKVGIAIEVIYFVYSSCFLVYLKFFCRDISIHPKIGNLTVFQSIIVLIHETYFTSGVGVSYYSVLFHIPMLSYILLEWKSCLAYGLVCVAIATTANLTNRYDKSLTYASNVDIQLEHDLLIPTTIGLLFCLLIAKYIQLYYDSITRAQVNAALAASLSQAQNKQVMAQLTYYKQMRNDMEQPLNSIVTRLQQAIQLPCIKKNDVSLSSTSSTSVSLSSAANTASQQMIQSSLALAHTQSLHVQSLINDMMDLSRLEHQKLEKTQQLHDELLSTKKKEKSKTLQVAAAAVAVLTSPSSALSASFPPPASSLFPFHDEPCDIVHLLESSVPGLSLTVKNSKCEILFDISPLLYRDSRFITDPKRLTRLFRTFVKNAIAWAHNDTSILIRAHPRNHGDLHSGVPYVFVEVNIIFLPNYTALNKLQPAQFGLVSFDQPEDEINHAIIRRMEGRAWAEKLNVQPNGNNTSAHYSNITDSFINSSSSPRRGEAALNLLLMFQLTHPYDVLTSTGLSPTQSYHPEPNSIPSLSDSMIHASIAHSERTAANALKVHELATLVSHPIHHPMPTASVSAPSTAFRRLSTLIIDARSTARANMLKRLTTFGVRSTGVDSIDASLAYLHKFKEHDDLIKKRQRTLAPPSSLILVVNQRVRVSDTSSVSMTGIELIHNLITRNPQWLRTCDSQQRHVTFDLAPTTATSSSSSPSTSSPTHRNTSDGTSTSTMSASASLACPTIILLTSAGDAVEADQLKHLNALRLIRPIRFLTKPVIERELHEAVRHAAELILPE